MGFCVYVYAKRFLYIVYETLRDCFGAIVKHLCFVGSLYVIGHKKDF